MPELVEGMAGEPVFKPRPMGLQEGDKAHFVIITADYKATSLTKTDGSVQTVYSLPMKCTIPKKLPEGQKDIQQFGLNKTNTRLLRDVLGTNTDAWVSAEFDALAQATISVSSGLPTTTFKILPQTIKKPSK